MKKLNKFSSMNKICKCRDCGKATHSAIDGNIGIELCRDCLEKAELENDHSDGRHENQKHSNCPSCKLEDSKMNNSDKHGKATEATLDKIWNFIGNTLDKNFDKEFGYKGNDGMYTRGGENIIVVDGKEYIITVKALAQAGE